MADLYSGRQQSTPIPLSSGMSYASLVNAMNQNFASINNQIANNINIHDGANKRIMLGKLPDGTYGLIISKEGFDVEDVVDQS